MEWLRNSIEWDDAWGGKNWRLRTSRKILLWLALLGLLFLYRQPLTRPFIAFYDEWGWAGKRMVKAGPRRNECQADSFLN